MDRELLSYLAGVMDSDGYFSIHRRIGSVRRDGVTPIYYEPKLGLNQVSPLIPELMRETFGGKVYRYTHATREGLPWFMWASWSNVAIDAARVLRPFLRLKCGQAEVIMRYRSLPRTNKITEELAASRAALYDEIRSLNGPRNPRYANYSPAAGS